MEVRAASATEGGIVEVRLGSPDGELLGKSTIPNTGGWQSWSSFKIRIKPVEGLRTVCLAFKQRMTPARNDRLASVPLWFAKVDEANTTLWAQFNDADPNPERVKINVRQTVFYPDQPNIETIITVRGFGMRHAATPWAPPTAEQIGLIGTHWSKGWIIENNDISHSVCSGITLGKHGDQWDNTSANTAEGYVKTIERERSRKAGIAIPSDTTLCGTTGSHIANRPAWSAAWARRSVTVTGNTIHDIRVRRLFTGAEMAGIKFHAAINTLIANNHIYQYVPWPLAGLDGPGHARLTQPFP